MLFRVFCLFFMFAAHAYAEVSIQAPDKAPAGSEIQISIAGSESAKDFVTIVSPETKAGKYDKFKYLRASPVTLSVPEDAGTFEIRVLSGESGYATLVTKEIVVTAVTASVSAPSEVKAGAIFEVSWEGPANSQDFVTIVPKGAKEGSYEQFKYPSRGGRTKVLEFVAPEEAGEYEMRYVTASKRYTLASTPISVISVEASVSVPANVEAGATFDVKWDGPNNPQDFITIVNRGEKEGIYGSYTYTKRSEKNKVAELQAPEIPGEYEVRYLTGNKRYTLASAPFAVGKVQASLDGPEEVMEGATFEVKWEGPDNLQDFITIVEAGTKEGEYGDYAYTKRKQGPRALRVVELSAPEQSGEFEIRYLTGQNKLTLAYQPIKIVPATAKLDASKTTTARSIFDVSWEGPGNNGDYVELILKGGEQREDLAYVRRGKVVQLQAPQTPGQYELRYHTAKKEKVLATREIEITPSKTPGSLSVVGDIGELQYSATKKLNVALILDASGSMLKTDVG
ncbi:MAG: hypothetical protein KDD53_08065, partial [Bdellovibrionales bacterium]|nr:hypothetical protein [Bdellovibrionales bacterium]